ncbi:MAG: Rpn family recombination-promoting nuclease/putative transposase [Oscillospiraceae bacterium]|nr:Rpn family recombination-promoting nuclease/putative transposase [Oscillospiraceae bacterium]
MAKLKYTLNNDILFKMLFVQYPELLKKLVAELLRITYDSIEKFEITNSEIPPETIGNKFCKLDINMFVNGQRVNIEIQVENEGDFPERSLFHWAREYSTALSEGENYAELPRTIIISIIYFKLFKCKEFHSEYQALEVTRHTPLTDKFNMHYFELPKLPQSVSADKSLELWLSLFKAKTEEELEKIEGLGVSVMKEAIGAYRHVSATKEFRELERMRSKARHDEAQALKNAEERGEKRSDRKWKSVVADKDAIIAELQAKLEKRS